MSKKSILVLIVIGIVIYALVDSLVINKSQKVNSTTSSKKLDKYKQKVTDKASKKSVTQTIKADLVFTEIKSGHDEEIALADIVNYKEHPLKNRVKIKKIRGTKENTIALLSLDGAIIQGSYTRLDFSERTPKITEDSLLGKLPDQVDRFPSLPNSFGSKVIEEQLLQKEVEDINVIFNANFWVLNNLNELTPCKSYHVYYRTVDSSVSRGELWCIDLNSGNVIQTVKKSRN